MRTYWLLDCLCVTCRLPCLESYQYGIPIQWEVDPLTRHNFFTCSYMEGHFCSLECVRGYLVHVYDTLPSAQTYIQYLARMERTLFPPGVIPSPGIFRKGPVIAVEPPSLTTRLQHCPSLSATLDPRVLSHLQLYTSRHSISTPTPTTTPSTSTKPLPIPSPSIQQEEDTRTQLQAQIHLTRGTFHQPYRASF